MGRSKKSPVTVRGNWFALSLEFLGSRACAQLSPHAVKMLVDLCSQFGPNAQNNGDLSAAPAVMRSRGWTGNSTRVAALQELLDAGLIVVTRYGNRTLCAVCDHAVAYRLRHQQAGARPGAYVTSEWIKDDPARAVRTDHKAPETWATWGSLRKGEVAKKKVSPPTAGQPPPIFTRSG